MDSTICLSSFNINFKNDFAINITLEDFLNGSGLDNAQVELTFIAENYTWSWYNGHGITNNTIQNNTGGKIISLPLIY